MTAPKKKRGPATKKRAPAVVRQAKKPAASRRPGARADFGAPIEEFFARQPPKLRAILDELRGLAEGAAPDAQASLKWGMPFFTVGGTMMCALTAHKAHVNLVLSGPPDAFADPEGRLEGDSKNGRHLKLTSVDELPRSRVRAWLRAAAELARQKA